MGRFYITVFTVWYISYNVTYHAGQKYAYDKIYYTLSKENDIEKTKKKLLRNKEELLKNFWF
jgi:hypothetical protein